MRTRWVCYTHAFFQALSQMLCIGFGLVSPKLTEELWVTIFSMGMGAAMYAMSLSFVVNVISTVDHPSRNYKNHVEELNEYMRVRCLPPDLRTRLRNYFSSLYPNRRIFDERSLVGHFSRTLTQDIHTARCEMLFANMPLFSDKDADGNDAEPALLSAICSMLSPEMAMPGERRSWGLRALLPTVNVFPNPHLLTLPKRPLAHPAPLSPPLLQASG